MAPRPYWNGYLELSLVSCPIALHTATGGGERVAFRQINKQTGNRLRQQLVDEVTREPVETEDKGRGYEYAKGAYLPVEDEELDAIAIESMLELSGVWTVLTSFRMFESNSAALFFFSNVFSHRLPAWSVY